MKMVFKSLAVLSAVVLLSSCAPNLAQNSYTYYGGGPIYAQQGVIQDIQYNVVVGSPDTGTGAVIGAGAGAIIGTGLASNSGAGLFGLIGGAIIGGVIGDSIERSNNETVGTLYIVRLRWSGGVMVSIIEQDPVPFCVGDHVYVVGNYQEAHLKLNEGYYVNNPRTGCFRNG